MKLCCCLFFRCDTHYVTECEPKKPVYRAPPKPSYRAPPPKKPSYPAPTKKPSYRAPPPKKPTYQAPPPPPRPAASKPHSRPRPRPRPLPHPQQTSTYGGYHRTQSYTRRRQRRSSPHPLPTYGAPRCRSIPVQNCYETPHLKPVKQDIKVTVAEVEDRCRTELVPTPKTRCWEEEEELCTNVPMLVEKPGEGVPYKTG